MVDDNLRAVFTEGLGIILAILPQLEISGRLRIIFIVVFHQPQPDIRGFTVAIEGQHTFPLLPGFRVPAVLILQRCIDDFFAILRGLKLNQTLPAEIQNQIPPIQLGQRDRRDKSAVGITQAAELEQKISPIIIFEHMSAVGIQHRVKRGAVYRNIPQFGGAGGL